MIGVKITELPSITLPYSGTESIPLVQNNETRVGSISSFADYVGAAIVTPSNVQAALSAEPLSSRNALNVYPSRPYLHGPNHGMQAFKKRLDRGESGALLFISDSTGVPTDSWIRNFADYLKSRYPNHRVEFRQIDADGLNTNTTLTVLQSGYDRQNWTVSPSVTGGNSPIYLSTYLREQMGGRYGGIEIEVAPTSNAVLNVNGYPNSNLELGGTWTSSYAFYLATNTSGRLNLYISDSTSSFRTITTSTASFPPLSVNTYVRYRALVDTGTDVGSLSAQYFYSTNQGQNWTKIGTTVTSTSSILSASSNQAWTIGRALQGTSQTGYKYSHFQLLKGSNYEPLIPERIDAFNVVAGATTATPTLTGAPIIYFDVIAVNGASINPSGWFSTSLSAAAWSLLRDRAHDACIISTSHNDVSLGDTAWGIRMDALRNLVSSRCYSGTGPSFIHICQNPESADYSATEIREQHNNRQAGIITYASKKGSTAFDAYQAFLDDGRPIQGILVREFATPPNKDGVHPTTLGYQVWSNKFIDSVFLDNTNENY